MTIKEKWQTLAGELDFRFHDGIDALIESPHAEMLIRQKMFQGGI